MVSAARDADSASADGCVPIEIGIGEAAGPTVEERRDAHEVVVAPAIGGRGQRLRQTSCRMPLVR